MDYSKPIVYINRNDYDYVVSIGNKCASAGILRNDLHIYGESFPFDFIPSTPKLVLKYLQDTSDFFPEQNMIRTKDDIWFGHYNVYDKYDETIQKFKRRFERLFEILQNKKRVLFVYTSEADIYNEMNNRYNDNYNELCNIKDYIETKYEYTNFTILAIHVNKTYEDTKNIINYTINVPEAYLSDDMSTHTPPICSEYRKTVEALFRDIFQHF